MSLTNILGSLVTTILGIFAGAGIVYANKMQASPDPLLYGLAGLVTAVCALLRDPAFVKALVDRLVSWLGPKAPPAALLLVLALPAFAQEKAPPLVQALPSFSLCNGSNSVCFGPTVTGIPYTFDLETGNVGPSLVFAGGVGLTVTRGGLAWGADALFGTTTNGGWNASLLGKIGPAGMASFRLGPILQHGGAFPGSRWLLGAGLGF